VSKVMREGIARDSFASDRFASDRRPTTAKAGEDRADPSR
jgi:hypothetical protein